MSPGEWNQPGSGNFLVNVPAPDGGGTTPATLFVMNHNVNLYLGLRIALSGLDRSPFAARFVPVPYSKQVRAERFKVWASG